MGESRVETGRGLAGWDAQGPGACLLVLMLNCSDAHAGHQENGPGQGSAASPWGLGLLLAAGKHGREPGAQLPFLIRQRAKLSAPTKR